MKDVKLNIVNATELKSDRKYILLFDNQTITMEDANNLISSLKRIGIKNSVGVILKGDVNTVRIVEQVKEKLD